MVHFSFNRNLVIYCHTPDDLLPSSFAAVHMFNKPFAALETILNKSTRWFLANSSTCKCECMLLSTKTNEPIHGLGSVYPFLACLLTF